MRRPPHVAALLVVAGLAFMGTSCGGSNSSATKTGDVKVVDNKFEPKSASVNVGDAVTWTFTGTVKHNVTPTGDNRAEWKASDTMKAGTYAHTFTKAGTYSYICTIHQGMNGSITVS